MEESAIKEFELMAHIKKTSLQDISGLKRWVLIISVFDPHLIMARTILNPEPPFHIRSEADNSARALVIGIDVQKRLPVMIQLERRSVERRCQSIQRFIKPFIE